MIHRNIKDINSLNGEISYIDADTGEVVNGVVGKIEYLDPVTAFVYVVSPYKEENTKTEPDGFAYRDIVVFDNKAEYDHGWYKDFVMAHMYPNG